MAKVKVKKKSNTSNAPKKTITIKKPDIKFKKPEIKFKKPNIKLEKPNFKKILSSNGFKTFLIVLGAVIVFVLIDLFVQYLNNGYSVAVVDGRRIPTTEYHKRLESSYGATIAQQLIDEELIKIEAKKADIDVKQEEIDEELDEIITSVGGEEAYKLALEQNNITEEDLVSQITLDILSRKILGPTIEYTEDDIKAFFEQYSKVLFPTDSAELEEGEKLDYELFKDAAEEMYIKQQVYNTEATWLEELKGEYKIQDNSATEPKYGILSATINIFKNLFEEANSNEIEETEETAIQE